MTVRTEFTRTQIVRAIKASGIPLAKLSEQIGYARPTLSNYIHKRQRNLSGPALAKLLPLVGLTRAEAVAPKVTRNGKRKAMHEAVASASMTATDVNDLAAHHDPDWPKEREWLTEYVRSRIDEDSKGGYYALAYAMLLAGQMIAEAIREKK